MLLKSLGLGGIAVAGVGVGAATARDHEATPPRSYSGALGISEIHDGSLYGGSYEPPFALGSDALDHVTIPPPRSPGPVELEIEVLDRRLEIGAGAFMDAWTFGGGVPGPTIRATEGQAVRIHLVNKTGLAHNLHLHGRHTPTMDGWEPIPPGGSFTYEVEAGPAGVHPYHCHVAPLSEHISRGLFGMFIVDPIEPRAPAHEVALAAGGFAVDGVFNAIVAWNGVAGFYEKFPIKVPVGAPVRAYVMNMVEAEPVMSFHLHAQTFGVIPAGIGSTPAFSGDVFTMSQGERAILEFDLPEVGRYMFHPHQHHLAIRGAMGWFAAV